MKRRLAVITVMFCVVVIGAGAASGESVQRGNLRLVFNGRFSPQALPRDRLAPVTVDLRGSVSTTDGSPAPRLERISIAVNRYGAVFTRGLPACLPGRLQQTTTQVALSRCRGALVGHGAFVAKIALPELPTFPVEGKLLAFNSRDRGRPAIVVHIYGSNPVQATIVLPFKITHPAGGAFGTVLTTRIPPFASDVGYITGISLTFGRRYRYAGEQRSFLSARCAAPGGFPGAVFPFARGSFSFVTGQTVPITLARQCRVR